MKTIKQSLFLFGALLLLNAFTSLKVFGQEEILSDGPNMELTDDISGGNYHFISEQTMVANNTIANGALVRYTAGTSILLSQGFKVEPGNNFKAKINSSLVALKQAEQINSSLEGSGNVPVQLEVYPNVSEGIFNVNYQSDGNSRMAIKVYNSSGGLVFSEPVAETGTLEINLLGLPEGVYLLKAASDSESRLKKLVIK